MDIEIKFPIIAGNDTIAFKLGILHPSKGTNIVRAVKALQTHQANDIAVPADWSKNGIIGNRGIIPPATDQKTAEARLKNKNRECFAW